jgi:hypothetical protein
VLARNKIYNRNQYAISAMDMTLLIPNLSEVTSGGESKIRSISNQALYMHEHGGAGEVLQTGGVTTVGSGPLNSTDPLKDYVTVKLPAGGDGTTVYQDAYAIYEYRFIPGDDVTCLKQTIQLGAPPFTPAVVTSAVYFNSPEAFNPMPEPEKSCLGWMTAAAPCTVWWPRTKAVCDAVL